MIRLLSPAHTPSFCLALSALILFWPAISLPMVRIEKFGLHQENSLREGVWLFLQGSDWGLGLIILGFSLVLPLLKLFLTLSLCLIHWDSRWRPWAHQFAEHAGRWSFLDVLLVAVLVMFLKLGLNGEVQFVPRPGVYLFALMVACSASATLCLPKRPHP